MVAFEWSGRAPAILQRRNAVAGPQPWHRHGLPTPLITTGIAALVLVGLASLGLPVTRDEGAYLTIGRQVLHGAMPYRDLFDHKGPALYFLAAGLVAASSGLPPLGQIVVARLAAEIALLVAAYGLYALGTLLWRRSVGVAAMCLWLLAAPVYRANSFSPDALAVAPVVWAMVVASVRLSPRRFALAGALVALATLLKPTAILALPGLLALVAFTARQATKQPASTRRIPAHLAAISLGFAAPWLLACSVFALTGGIGSLLRDVVAANLGGYPPDPSDQVLSSIASALALCPIVWVTTSGAVALVAFQSFSSRQFRAGADVSRGATLAILVVCGSLPLTAHAFLHYWLQLLPWSCLLAAWLIVKGAALRHAVGQQTRRGTIALWLWVPGLLVLAICGLVSVVASLTIAGIAYGARIQTTEQVAFAAQVAAFAPPDTRLLVGPAEPEYYVLAARPPSTPYVYLLPVDLTQDRLDAAVRDIDQGRFDAIVWGVGWDPARSEYRAASNPLPPSPASRRLESAIQGRYRVEYVDAALGLAIYARR